jgi:hypothetical protein
VKVRKKIVEYEARQFTKENSQEIADWCGGSFNPHGLPELKLTTRDGALRIVEYGDWILKTDDGFDFCKDKYFWDIFEEVK